jgi:hypothetical protein
MVFKLIMAMMGVTSVLLLIRSKRHDAQLKRIHNQLKLIIQHGKEAEERQAGKAEPVNTDRNKSIEPA